MKILRKADMLEKEQVRRSRRCAGGYLWLHIQASPSLPPRLVTSVLSGTSWWRPIASGWSKCSTVFRTKWTSTSSWNSYLEVCHWAHTSWMKAHFWLRFWVVVSGDVIKMSSHIFTEDKTFGAFLAGRTSWRNSSWPSNSSLRMAAHTHHPAQPCFTVFGELFMSWVGVDSTRFHSVFCVVVLGVLHWVEDTDSSPKRGGSTVFVSHLFFLLNYSPLSVDMIKQ